jgi:hypothetical protein
MCFISRTYLTHFSFSCTCLPKHHVPFTFAHFVKLSIQKPLYSRNLCQADTLPQWTKICQSMTQYRPLSGPVYMEASYPLLGNGEIQAIIETYSNPRWLFTWCSRVTRLGEIPAERGGISLRRDKYFPCKHFALVLTRPPEIECICFAFEI